MSNLNLHYANLILNSNIYIKIVNNIFTNNFGSNYLLNILLLY